MTLKQLREKFAALMGEAKAIKATAGDDGMTEEQAATFTAKLNEADTYKARIVTIESASGRSLPESVSGNAQPIGLSASGAQVRERWQDDPTRGFRDPKAYFTAVLNADLGRANLNTREQNAILARQFRDVQGQPIKQTVGSDEQGGYADPYGGYLIPEGFLPTLLQLNPEADPTSGRTLAVPMASPTVKIPARVDKNHTNSVSGGLRVYRRAEADTVSSSRQEYEQVVLQANTLFGLNYSTEEVLSDSPISVAALLQAGFANEMPAKVLNEKLFGTGVGEYEGVMNAPALVSVSKETSQAANTINTQNILKMRARCYGFGSAIWLANHDTFPQLMQLVLAVGSGGSSVSLYNIREDGINVLLGRPVFFTEFCKTLGTTGDLILGDWSQYLEGTYQTMQSAESIHVRFVNHERTFKFWMRNDGRCWWRTALTVKQGSNTLSPFVALATRA